MAAYEPPELLVKASLPESQTLIVFHFCNGQWGLTALFGLFRGKFLHRTGKFL